VVEDRPEQGLAFVCGGVGVAPALAILREEARRPTPRPMLLLYGNRVATQILARGELEGLSAAGRLKVVHVLGEPSPGLAGETGQLDTAVIARRCEAAARAGWLFVLCGPPPMLREARWGRSACRAPASWRSGSPIHDARAARLRKGLQTSFWSLQTRLR